MSDHAPRLAARSAGAIADTSLLRAGRTEVRGVPDAAQPTLPARIRILLGRFVRAEA